MSILSLLKEATLTRHASLESWLPLLDASLSRSVYKNLIQKFFCYYAPLELRLLTMHSGKRGQLNYVERQKTPLLMRDLVALGETPTHIGSLERCAVLPNLSSQAESWGCLYVIEGATLGGQIISKRLRNHLALDDASGGAFFNGYGGQTGVRWKSFCASLNDYVAKYDGDTDVIFGAIQTFETLDIWLRNMQLVRSVPVINAVGVVTGKSESELQL